MYSGQTGTLSAEPVEQLPPSKRRRKCSPMSVCVSGPRMGKRAAGAVGGSSQVLNVLTVGDTHPPKMKKNKKQGHSEEISSLVRQGCDAARFCWITGFDS